MPLENIEKEWKSAEHLMFVSLKYTRTGDVMVNLIKRWASMISLTIDALLNSAKKKKKIKQIPKAPKLKQKAVMDLFEKDKTIQEVLKLYSTFRKVDKLHSARENEFRKNVTLRLFDEGKEIAVNLQQIKEWYELLKNYYKFVKSYIK